MQRSHWVFFVIVPFVLLMLNACKKDPPVEPEQTLFQVEFDGVVGELPFELGQTYTHIPGQDYQLERFRFLLSDMVLVNANGEEVALESDMLVDLGEKTFRTPDSLNDEGVSMAWSVPAGEYRSIKFNLGIPESRNNGNPADFPSSHPLSIRRGMHWTWSTGYIFMQIDGRADTLDDGQASFDHGLVFHPGTNDLFKSFTWDESTFTIEAGQTYTQTVKVDLAKVFAANSGDVLDLRKDNFTHSTPVGSDAFTLAERVMNNLVNGAIQPQ